jgi:TolB-like protein/Flp pilus assembly protein TadD
LSAEELRSLGAQATADAPKSKPTKQTVRWVLGVGLCLAGGLIAWFSFFSHSGLLSNQRIAEAVPIEKSVAVLPFESLSESKSDAYFADGVQDEILNNLAKIAQLKVISRTSVMQYRTDTKRDLRQIATALGVANVLEGTVRRDGNHVRVSTELIDARNDNTIWADSYDRDLTNIFAIQSEIAQTVASRLSARLSPEEENRISEKPTDNSEAYDLYLHAKQLLEANYNYWVLPKSEKEIYSKIIGLLEQAIQKDRKFALAYCLIAKAHDILYFDRTDHSPERRALGDAAVDEALRLRPDLAEAHLAMAAHLYYCYRDFERARVQVGIAAEALSNNSALHELTALIARVRGRWENAVAGLETAITLDPQNPELVGILVETYRWLRRYQDAERIEDRLFAIEPDKPEHRTSKAWWTFVETADVKTARAAYEVLPSSVKDDPGVASDRAYLAMCARDFDAAEQVVRESSGQEIGFVGGALVPHQIFALWIEFLRGNHPTPNQFGAAREQLSRKVEADPSNPYLMTALAYADMALGRKGESIQEGKRAMEMRPISEDAFNGPDVAAYVSMLYALSNQLDSAFDQLNILVKIPSGLPNYGDLKTSPGWDPLRKDPRFDKLLAELAPRD